jgi:hypothetical protein
MNERADKVYFNVVHDPQTSEITEINGFQALYGGTIFLLVVEGAGAILLAGYVVQEFIRYLFLLAAV